MAWNGQWKKEKQEERSGNLKTEIKVLGHTLQERFKCKEREREQETERDRKEQGEKTREEGRRW